MSWSKDDITKINGKKRWGSFLVRHDPADIDAINGSGKYRVKRAVTRVAIHDCLVDTTKLDDFKKAMGEMTVSAFVNVHETYVDIEDLAPPSPSVALEMVFDEDGVFRPFVTQDSVEEFLLQQGEDETNARKQAGMFMMGLIMHFRDKHEHDYHRFEKAPVPFCSCPLLHGNAWRDRSQSIWEAGTVTPESLVAFSLLDDTTIKSLVDHKARFDSISFGTKRLKLLRGLAVQIRDDIISLEGDMATSVEKSE